MATSKVVLVTGTSSGFGALTARHLALAGCRVYASMRGPDATNSATAKAFTALAAVNSNIDIRVLDLDVTKEDSVRSAIQRIIGESNKIDVLVHNAGHMCYGPLESYTAEQLLQYYDVNAVGAHRVNRAALPHMRKAGTGKVIWIGSTSTAGGTPPLLGPYFAAKAAMDSLAVTYASELSGWGIESTIVSPGVFTAGTNHFDHAGKGSDDEVEAEYLQGPYSSVPERVMNGLKAGDTPGDIADVARAILDVVTAPYGKVPFRVNIDPWNDGGDTVNQVKDLARREFYYKTGLTDILHVKSRGNVL